MNEDLINLSEPKVMKCKESNQTQTDVWIQMKLKSQPSIYAATNIKQTAKFKSKK